MTKISGAIFLVVGGIVSISSYLIDKQKMKIFIFIGYFFVALGAAKLLSSFIFQSPKEDQPKRQSPQQKTISTEEKVMQKAMDPHGYIGQCAKCSTPMRRINIYCHRCGSKVQ